MANDQHVALLKQGVDVWNAWREESQANLADPDLPPNISPEGAEVYKAFLVAAHAHGQMALVGGRHPTLIPAPDLSEADLSGVDLRGANLGAANLSRAVLSGADLSRANLTHADLSQASLTNATLYKADLNSADLNEADISWAYLVEANLTMARLDGADLSSADLSRAKFDSANLCGARLVEANLSGAALERARLTGAKLTRASLVGSYLLRADLDDADLSGADLSGATLVEADLTRADLTGCRIYGVSAWSLKLENAKQQNLVITNEREPEVTVDNIEVAQFMNLLLHNRKLRDVIDTITSKAVLILGRFTDERKAILDALREELRERNYLPILFDFEKPRSLDTDETVTLLARMARFIVADISDAKSVLQELRAIVPDLPSVPVQPIILAMQEEPGMFDFYRNRPSFLAVHRYASQEQLLADLGEKVIRPAELKVLELRS